MRPISIDQSHALLGSMGQHLDWSSLNPNAVQYLITHPSQVAQSFARFINQGGQLAEDGGEPDLFIHVNYDIAPGHPSDTILRHPKLRGLHRWCPFHFELVPVKDLSVHNGDFEDAIVRGDGYFEKALDARIAEELVRREDLIDNEQWKSRPVWLVGTAYRRDNRDGVWYDRLHYGFPGSSAHDGPRWVITRAHLSKIEGTDRIAFHTLD